jgi:hypothetical protein
MRYQRGLAVVVVLAVVLISVGACTAPPPASTIVVPAQAQTLADVSYTNPETTVGIAGGCSIDLMLQPLSISGIIVSMPTATAKANNTAVSVPNVTVSLPAAGFSGVPSAAYNCPIINGTTTVSIELPGATQSELGSLNMKTGKLSLPSAVTVDAAITIVIGIAITFEVPFTIPLPPVSVTIP